MAYIPEKNCQGVTKAGACSRQFRIDYNGEDYYVQIDTNINGTRFLKVPEITFRQGLFGGTQTLKPKASSTSPDGLYETIFNLPEFKTKYANIISSVKGQAAKDGLTQKAEEAAKRSGTFKNTWNKSNPGTPIPGAGVAQPAPNPGAPTPVPILIIPGGPIAIPKEIEDLQKSGDEAIPSLFPGLEKKPELRIITYPFDASYKNSQDHVLFEMFSYKAPQEDLITSANSDFFKIVSGGLRRNTNLRSFIGMVKLPIPNNLAMSNGISWGEDRANPVEAGAFFSALGQAQNVLQGNVYDLLTQTFGGFGKLLDAIKGQQFTPGTPAGLLLSSFIAQYALGKVGINVNPAQFIARGTGTTINPNLELLFNGPKLRSFSFAFEFAPNGVDDARAARSVMRFFKEGMAANRVATNTIFIGSPNVFRISYRGTGGKVIKGLNRFKICALTACEINYSPDGTYQSYDDPYVVSMPARTTMTLSFTELTPIFAQDYRIPKDPSKIDPSILDAFIDFDGSPDVDPITETDDIGF